MLAIADGLRQCANLCCTMNLLSASIELIAVLTMRFFFFFFFGLKKDFIAQKTQPETGEKQKDQAWTHL